MHGANDAMWLQSPYLCFHLVKWSAAVQSSVGPRDVAFFPLSFFSRWIPKRRQSRLKFLDDLYFLVTQQPAGWFVRSPVSVCLNSQIKLWVAFFKDLYDNQNKHVLCCLTSTQEAGYRITTTQCLPALLSHWHNQSHNHTHHTDLVLTGYESVQWPMWLCWAFAFSH